MSTKCAARWAVASPAVTSPARTAWGRQRHLTSAPKALKRKMRALMRRIARKPISSLITSPPGCADRSPCKKFDGGWLGAGVRVRLIRSENGSELSAGGELMLLQYFGATILLRQ